MRSFIFGQSVKKLPRNGKLFSSSANPQSVLTRRSFLFCINQSTKRPHEEELFLFCINQSTKRPHEEELFVLHQPIHKASSQGGAFLFCKSAHKLPRNGQLHAPPIGQTRSVRVSQNEFCKPRYRLTPCLAHLCCIFTLLLSLHHCTKECSGNSRKPIRGEAGTPEDAEIIKASFRVFAA